MSRDFCPTTYDKIHPKILFLVFKQNCLDDCNGMIFKEISSQNLLNRKNIMDGLQLLGLICDHSLKVVFFDPQYRGVLDKLKYGNEGVLGGREDLLLYKCHLRLSIFFL